MYKLCARCRRVRYCGVRYCGVRYCGVRYCGVDCQKAHWLSQHGWECKPARQQQQG
jgi:hypothetical protein